MSSNIRLYLTTPNGTYTGAYAYRMLEKFCNLTHNTENLPAELASMPRWKRDILVYRIKRPTGIRAIFFRESRNIPRRESIYDAFCQNSGPKISKAPRIAFDPGTLQEFAAPFTLRLRPNTPIQRAFDPYRAIDEILEIPMNIREEEEL